MSVSIDSGRPTLQIKKLQTGDPKEFQKLYKFYFDDFVKEASLLLKNGDDAPAIVSHSFIKCWLKCNALTSTTYFFAFLRTTINTHCYGTHQSNNYSSEQQTILQDIICNTDCQGRSREELYSDVATISKEGKTKAREIFTKLYVRHISVTEIARETGLSEETIQEAVNLAYKILHLILSHQPM